MFLRCLTVFCILSVKHLGLVLLEGQGVSWEMPRYQPTALQGEVLHGKYQELNQKFGSTSDGQGEKQINFSL